MGLRHLRGPAQAPVRLRSADGRRAPPLRRRLPRPTRAARTGSDPQRVGTDGRRMVDLARGPAVVITRGRTRVGSQRDTGSHERDDAHGDQDDQWAAHRRDTTDAALVARPGATLTMPARYPATYRVPGTTSPWRGDQAVPTVRQPEPHHGGHHNMLRLQTAPRRAATRTHHPTSSPTGSRAAKATLGDARLHPRPPLPARRGHPLGRRPRRQLPAVGAGPGAGPRPSTSCSAACTSWPSRPTSSPATTSR